MLKVLDHMRNAAQRWLPTMAGLLLLWATPAAQAQVACTPAINPSPAIAFQTLTLLANCDPAAGPVTESWTFVCACGPTTNVTRLPAAPVATTSFSTAGGVTVTLSVQPATGPPSVFNFSLVVQTTTAAVPARLASVRSGAAPAAVRGQVQRQMGLAADRSRQMRASTAAGAPGGASGARSGEATSGNEGSKDSGQPSSAATLALASPSLQAYAMTGSQRVQQAALGAFSAYHATSDDLAFGADLRLKGPWTLGASLASHRSQADTGQASAGQQEQRAASVLLYASYAAPGSYFVDVAAAAQNGLSHLRRQAPSASASASGPATLTATSPTEGLGLAVGGGLQKRWGAHTLELSARAEHLSSRIGAFDESGSVDALHVAAQSARNTTLTLGLLGQRAWPASWGIALAQLRLDWAQAVQSQQGAASAYLIDASRPVAVETELAPQQRRQGWLGLGLSAQWPRGLSGFIDYAHGFGTSSVKAQRWNLGLKVAL